MFSGKKMLKTLLFLVICISLVLILPLMVSANEVVTNELKTLYLHPNVNWETDNAWFALYYFDYNDHYDCVPMTDEDGDGIYEAVLPDGYPNFLFYRMDSAVTEFDGDHVLHQTDCFEYAEENQCYVLAEESWESGNWEAAPAVVNANTDVDESEDASGNAEITNSTTEPDPTVEPTTESDSVVVPTVEDEIVNTTEDVIEETTSEETTTATDVAETEIQKFYLSLDQVDQDYTWAVVVPGTEARFNVGEETEVIYSIELPENIDTIILHGKGEDDAEIFSVEISLEEIQEKNCIVALSPKQEEDFGIEWGTYDPETEELTIDTQDTVTLTEGTVVEEETDNTVETTEATNPSEDPVPTEETVTTEETEATAATETSETVDTVS